MQTITTTKRILLKISALILILFAGIMRMSYATDTYSVIEIGFRQAAEGMLYYNGRATVVLLASTCIGFYRIYHDKYLCNYADRLRCEHIGTHIAAYEAETGNTIRYIGFYSDAHSQQEQYPGLYHEGDLNTSSFLQGWSDLSAINYFLGTNYERAEWNEEY